MSKFRLVKWHSVEEAVPVDSGYYIVLISYAEQSTVLYFDSEERAWIDENSEIYKVSYWCDLPDHPLEVQSELPVPVVLNEKVKLYFTIDELVTFRENLAFVLGFCDVPNHSYEQLRSLLVYFENYTYLGRQE